MNKEDRQKMIKELETKIDSISDGICPVCGAVGLKWDRDRTGWRLCPICNSTINLGKLVDNHIFACKFAIKESIKRIKAMQEE